MMTAAINGGACEIEFSRVKQVSYASMTFGAKSWAVLDFADGDGKFLAYMDSMTQAEVDGGGKQLYFRAFLFSFKQLNAEMVANRIIISTSGFQQILDVASDMLQQAPSAGFIANFLPNVPVRGRWIWTLSKFADWAAAPVFRHVHLATADEASIKFIFR